MKNKSKNTCIRKPKATISLIMANYNLSSQPYTKEISKDRAHRWDLKLLRQHMIHLLLCHQILMFIIFHLVTMFTGQASQCLTASIPRCMNGHCGSTKAARWMLLKHIIQSCSQGTPIPRKALSKRKAAKAVYKDTSIQRLLGSVMAAE